MKKLKLFQTAKFVKNQMIQYANLMFDEVPACKTKATVIYAKCLSGILKNIPSGDYAWYLPITDKLVLYLYNGQYGYLFDNLKHIVFYPHGYFIKGFTKYRISSDENGMRVDVVEGWNVSDIGFFQTEDNKIFSIDDALGTPLKIKISTYDRNGDYYGSAYMNPVVVDGNDKPLGVLNGATKPETDVHFDYSHVYNAKELSVLFGNQLLEEQVARYLRSFRYTYLGCKTTQYNNIVWGVPIQYTHDGFVWLLASKAEADKWDEELCEKYLSLVEPLQGKDAYYNTWICMDDNNFKEVNPAPVTNVDIKNEIDVKNNVNVTVNKECSDDFDFDSDYDVSDTEQEPKHSSPSKKRRVFEKPIRYELYPRNWPGKPQSLNK